MDIGKISTSDSGSKDPDTIREQDVQERDKTKQLKSQTNQRADFIQKIRTQQKTFYQKHAMFNKSWMTARKQGLNLIIQKRFKRYFCMIWQLQVSKVYLCIRKTGREKEL